MLFSRYLIKSNNFILFYLDGQKDPNNLFNPIIMFYSKEFKVVLHA
jgi:hypothetical protein